MTEETLDNLTIADWCQRLKYLRRCAETRPYPEVFTEAENVSTFVKDTVAAIQKGLLDGGLDAECSSEELEGAIYGFIRKANPGRRIFSTMEYWGENIDTLSGAEMKARVTGFLSSVVPVLVEGDDAE